MLTPKCPAWRRGGRYRHIVDAEAVRAVALLACLYVATAASAQNFSDIESQMPRAVGQAGEPLPQGQQSPDLPPAVRSPPPTSAPGVSSPTTSDPKPAPPTRTEPRHSVSKELAQQVDALAAKREFAKAIAAIDEALKTDNRNAELYRLRATVHCRAGNLKLCLEDADRAVASDPEYPPTRLYRASVRINAGLAKAALDDCGAVIKLQPASPLGHNCRGIANRGLREFSQAIADFDEALRRDAKFALAHYNKGIAYILQNQFKDAIASLSSSIDINPKHDDSFAQRGKARIGLDDVAGARADYGRAMSLNRNNFVAAVGMQGLHVGKALDALSEKK